MHRTQKKKGFPSSVKGVSQLPRPAKTRICCKLQLWMWRKRRETRRIGIFRTKKRACGISFGPWNTETTRPEKRKRKVRMYHTSNVENSLGASVLVSPLGSDTGATDMLKGKNSPLKLCDSVTSSEPLTASTSLHTVLMDTIVSACDMSPIVPTATRPNPTNNSHVQLCEMTEPLKLPRAVRTLSSTESNTGVLTAHLKGPGTMVPVQRPEVDGPSGQFTAVSPGQEHVTSQVTQERIAGRKTSQTDIGVLRQEIQEFLKDFYRMYGCFIPFQKRDIMRHLERKFHTDFSDRKNVIFSEVIKYRTAIVQKPVASFQVVYKKHTLTLDDLSTLADQNWLNDQVINMYGELILESSHHQVHFLNSFFHRQLMTKGYDGVKRWTKQVDLFSKTLLLVPIHLEVHWCLVTADIDKKKICIYDSQGNALQKVARNILKYLMTEAKEKKHSDFESGWKVSYDEIIPQQTNENDCGVFILEYSRCLALAKPLQFSQRDIPKIRKRIYKELCDCKIHEQP
ncbi:sentrin-specific protease 5-like [Spinachia spinachia]